MWRATRFPSKTVGLAVFIWLVAILLWSKSSHLFGSLTLLRHATQPLEESKNQLWPDQLVPKEAAPTIEASETSNIRDIQNATLSVLSYFPAPSSQNFPRSTK